MAVVAERPGSAWLDGGGHGWSILTWDPSEVVTTADRWPDIGRRLTRPGGSEAPFAGGVLGYVGYGAGRVVEPVPGGGPTPEPEVHLARYDGGLCYRHADDRWLLGGTAGFRTDAERILAEAQALPPPPPACGSAVQTDERAGYEARIRQILEWIAAGDCYQVNLSRPVRVAGAGSAFEAYRRLASLPASHGAYLRVDERVAVLSNSPELLLEVRGRSLQSLPIKGTRRRDPGRDAQLRAELFDAPKDRAELTMIVDLVRNDLGRVARIGSVRTGERQITTYPTVHHASWPVFADLAEGRDAWDALAALFPPGSVTGAPKIRACQRIAELEPASRGVYCGAIGYVADGGDATWSVAIRVAVFDGEEARYHVGGGIVAASSPAEEWDETVAKETALRRALVRDP